MSSLEQVKYEPALYYTDREGFHYNIRWDGNAWNWNLYGPVHRDRWVQVLTAGVLGAGLTIDGALAWLIEHKELLIRENRSGVRGAVVLPD